MHAILAIARVTLAEARSARLHWVALAILAAAAGAGDFASRLALAEPGQFRIAMAAALARLGLVALVAIFAATSIARERQDGQWRFMFARPVARGDYVLGKSLGLALLALAGAAAAGLLLAALPAPPGTAWRSLAWAGLLFGEAVITSLFALACAVSLAHVVPALAATACFYLLARSSGNLVALASDAGAPAASLLGLLVPRLDLFARSEWLLYGDPIPFGWLAVQAAVAAILLAALAIADLQRRAL